MTTPTTARRAATVGLVACDIDGTLLRTGSSPSPAVVAAVAEVRSAGHHLVLATGRSLAGALIASRQLEIREGYIVASNGAVTARIGDSRCTVRDKRPAPARKTLEYLAPAISVNRFLAATEIVGYGYKVSARFPADALSGIQVPSKLEELWAVPTPRIVLAGRNAADLMLELQGLGVTANAVGRDWIDVTAADLSKATALERVRATLGVHPARTMALGDGSNDREMFRWAELSIAMGDAAQAVQDAADRITGTVETDGAAQTLHEAALALTDSGRCQWMRTATTTQRCAEPAVGRVKAAWRCAGHGATEEMEGRVGVRR